MPKRPKLMIHVKGMTTKEIVRLKDQFAEAMKRDQNIIVDTSKITMYQEINGKWVEMSPKKPWWRFW